MKLKKDEKINVLEILPDTHDNEESFIDDNDDKLINELYTDIEALNFLNMMDLEKYINYPGEKDTNEVMSDKEILDLTTNLESENESVEDDDSTEMRQISHQEALNAVEILEHYIVQNDFSEMAQFEHGEALLKLQKEIRKLQIKAFKQTSIKTYFELVD
ncbi:26560_t:CDS:2 [Gigaspora margarita]|uniref:26560_t:CDS:1 n=1 Tax=Gigaspora margarita TaxID=4874 RepID=A0ABN7UD13_GIGMA|nr:26560_t:CDS:2 [Gigaspora margarita]